MQDIIFVTGIVLKQVPIGEYDRRVCILTKEKGKISAIARGAKKPGNRLSASTNPFAFGKFKLDVHKDYYIIAETEIKNYFEELRIDYIGAYYGFYLCEIADYYTRENNDDREMLKLLYQSLKALIHPSIPDKLVKAVFEIKSVVVNGEFPGIEPNIKYDSSTIYAINFIVNSSIEKLYTFSLKEKNLIELSSFSESLRKRFMDRDFKSLEILKTL